MKPSLPRFIYFTDKDAQYILCTEYPFCIGQVWKFTRDEAFAMKIGELVYDNYKVSVIPNYRVLVAANSSLVDENIQDFTKDAKEMSSFFLSRINEKPRAWDRYKIEKL